MPIENKLEEFEIVESGPATNQYSPRSLDRKVSRELFLSITGGFACFASLVFLAYYFWDLY
jgi:hypothetical protein